MKKLTKRAIGIMLITCFIITSNAYCIDNKGALRPPIKGRNIDGIDGLTSSGAMRQQVTLDFFLEPDFLTNNNAHAIYLLDTHLDTHYAVTIECAPDAGIDYQGRSVFFDFSVVPQPYLMDKKELRDNKHYAGYMELKFDNEGNLSSYDITIGRKNKNRLPWLQGSLESWFNTQTGKPFNRTNSTFPVLGEEKDAEVLRLLHVIQEGTSNLSAENQLEQMGIMTVPALMGFLKSRTEGQKNIAKRILVKIGPLSCQSLIEGLKDEDSKFREDISSVLESMGKRAGPALGRAMKDSRLRVYAAPILRNIYPATPTVCTVSPISDIGLLPLPEEGSLPDRTIIVYGGIGAVMSRFYKEHVEQLAERYSIKLVAVDIQGEPEAVKRIKEQGLPYEAYICVPPSTPLDENVDNFLKGVVDEKPAGVLILTRPDTHLAIMKWALGQNASGHKMQVYVEKPIVLPEHVDETLKLQEQNKEWILPIDFFFDNPSALDAVKLLKEFQFGKLKAIRGRMIENVEVEKGREWLVTPEISGGGLGMDMMVHLVALGEMLLERFGISFKDMKINPNYEDTFFSRYKGVPKGTETYARVSGDIHGVTVDLGAGKGTHTNAYYLILEGSEGEIEINLGTENTPAFLEMRGKNGEMIYHEDYGVDIGYNRATRKIFSQAQGLGQVPQRELDFRTSATSIAVGLLEKARKIVRGHYQTHTLRSNPDEALLIPRPEPPTPNYKNFGLQNVKKPVETVSIGFDRKYENRYHFSILSEGRDNDYGFRFTLLNDRLQLDILQVPMADSNHPENNMYDNGVALTVLKWLAEEAKRIYPKSKMPFEIIGIACKPELLRIIEEGIFEPESIELYRPMEDKWSGVRDFDIYSEFGPLTITDYDTKFNGGKIKISKSGDTYIVMNSKELEDEGIDVFIQGHKILVTVAQTGRVLDWITFTTDFGIRGIPVAEPVRGIGTVAAETSRGI